LLCRVPLRTIHEERVLEESRHIRSPQHDYVARNLYNDLFSNHDYSSRLSDAGVSKRHVAALDRVTSVEQLAFMSTYETKSPDEDDIRKLVKIKFDTEVKDLISLPGSIMNILSNYELRIVRVYALLDKDGEAESTLREVVKEAIATRAGR
jgi:hypothetical protein